MKRILLLLLLLPTLASAASTPPADPLLRINTEMHTAVIWGLGVDRAERLAVTGSADKTLKLWDLKEGRLLRTLRVPVDSGNEGKLYTAALSPDGSTVAAGGWTGWNWGRKADILFFNTTSGELTGRLSGLPATLKHLAFSDDGTRLAVTMAGKEGVRLYGKRAGEWQLLGSDAEYGDKSEWCDFAPDGRLVTSSHDGFIRLYDPQLTLLHKEKMSDGEHPFAVAFNAHGSRIAVGYDSKASVTVLDGETLRRLFSPKINLQKKHSLSRVAWSADGEFLYAAGSYVVNKKRVVVRWARGGKGKRSTFAAATNTITGLHPLRDGRLLFASFNPSFGLLSRNGSVVWRIQPATADFRDGRQSLTLSRDGRIFGFATQQWGRNTAVFSLKKLDFTAGKETLRPPKESVPQITLTQWKNNRHPRLNGAELTLKHFERSRSRAMATDGSSFLLGADWNLYSFAADGSRRWKKPAPGTVWAVNLSKDGRLAVAAFGDGTIRWYRASDGELLLSFFSHRDGKRWVAWTPSGYYAASAGGDELIGWHLNHGRDGTPDFFPAAKFRSVYYRPDVVRQILVTLDEEMAVEKADAASRKRRPKVTVKKMLPPVVTILSPAQGSSFSGRTITISYRIKAPSGEPITGVKALVDGVAVSTPKGLRRQKGTGSITIPVPEKGCEVALLAENRYTASTPATLRLTWGGGAPRQLPEAMKPNLYLLAIGVGAYDDPGLTLKFPGKDARDFAAAVQKQQGRLYGEVKVKELADGAADRGGIMDGLEWLERQTTNKDIAMLFISGHGQNDNKGNYWFLPRDVDAKHLRRSAVPWMTIKDVLTDLPGKRILFIDTCHSGGVMGRKGAPVDLAAISNDLRSAENGVVVFASSTARQYSLENPAWNNGAFTKALVEGLDGKGDLIKDGRITINELNTWVAERVKALTEGMQTPTLGKPSTVPDFPVAVR